eukprot:jgi/Phyca11/119854/e_gw1.39.431.1
MKLLPVANSAEDAIAIDPSQTSQESEAKQGKLVETVAIKDVGCFSRKQIEPFKRIQNLKGVVQSGLEMHKWLIEDGVPTLPAEYHQIGAQVAEDVLASFPHKQIAGLPDSPEYSYAMLYRAVPPMWLTDAAIKALCLRLSNDYPSCRFAGFQTCVATARRK